MDIHQFVRDAPKVHAAFKELADGRTVVLKPLKIYIPQRYEERGLADVGSRVHILGIHALTVEDKYYCVLVLDAIVEICPSQTNRIKMDGDDYLEFVFNPGDILYPFNSVVCNDTLVYEIFDETFAKGNIPWYLDVEDLSRIFDTAQSHAGANIGQEQEVTQLIVSVISRSQDDRTKFWRTTIDSFKDLNDPKKKPVFIPLSSVRYAATNTMTKLGGSYFGQGVISALIHPSQRTERIEKLLRK